MSGGPVCLPSGDDGTRSAKNPIRVDGRHSGRNGSRDEGKTVAETHGEGSTREGVGCSRQNLRRASLLRSGQRRWPAFILARMHFWHNLRLIHG